MRFSGFDYARPERVASVLRGYGFGAPEPIHGDGWRLAVVDTSGFHYRGYAPPGTTRWEAIFGANHTCSTRAPPANLPRRNLYWCAETLSPMC